MNLEDAVASMAGHWMATKSARCHLAGGPHDLAPMVDMRFADGGCELALLGKPTQVFEAIVAASRVRRVWPLTHFAVLADAVARAARRDEFSMPQRGDLLAARERNEPGVQDVLVLEACEVTTGRFAGAVVRYSINDEGMPEFGPVEIQAPVAGAVPRAMRRSLEYLAIHQARNP